MSTSKELWRLSATECIDLLKRGEVSPLELVEAARARWQETDPIVNAMPITCWDQARERALEIQRAGHPDPPPPGYLYGLPVAVKDVAAVKGVLHTNGSRLFADNVAQEDDPLVQRLRERGAVIIGKTNTPEFACGSHTFNELFGVTRNPWDPGLSAGGSSGGSGVTLAVGSAWLATGTDLGGSLRNPAAWNGVVGLRTTPGLVPSPPPRAPPPAAAWRLASVAGPMARGVADAALFLDAMTSQAAAVMSSAAAMTSSAAAVTSSAAASGCGGGGAGTYQEVARAGAAAGAAGRAPSGLRVAFSPNLGGITPVDPEVSEICREAARWLWEHAGRGGQGEGGQAGAGAGAGVCAGPLAEACPDLSDAPRLFRVLRALACRDMVALLEVPGAIETIKPECVWQIREAQEVSSTDVEWAEGRHDALVASRDAFFSRYDLLACPAAMMAPFPVEMRWPQEFAGTKFHTYIDWLLLAAAVSLLGGPAISVPCGFTKAGLPVGLSLAGPPGSERRVLEAAAAYEAAHAWRAEVPRDPAARPPAPPPGGA